MTINIDVIGVSQTWNSFDNPTKTNVEIPGYSYFHSQSDTQSVGVALYVKLGITPIPRPDIGKDSADFESVWVEVENKEGKNCLFCCAYRHPTLPLDIFYEYLQETLSNPAVFKKKLISPW